MVKNVAEEIAVQLCESVSASLEGKKLASFTTVSSIVKVTKAIEGLIPLSVRTGPADPRRKELEKMEEEKMVIDKEAESLVRKELWAGLVEFLMAQTVVFARLKWAI
ncbi:hypothetical protein Sjap_008640 [Stephania japonica]|uniref:Calcium uniporter protein C-terminal domain-containing protein n=1 Tax=Stephania japonica TaxID=461633 RepID=A0AAP0JQL9_9MAGN